ncbi:MAG: DUF99 family protein [DPANN group archaeon]|nr:DUF99 family protein [DPANN group archaeon]
MKSVIKKEVRVMGIDDAPFTKGSRRDTMILGTIFRGGQFMDGIVSTKARVDGNNATKKIIEMVNRTKFKPQLQALILDGIAVGGFNVIDVERLNKTTGIGVIVVMRNYPDFKKIHRALRKLKMEKKIGLLEKAGEVRREGKIHFQVKGMHPDTARLILRTVTTRAYVPEPIRVAHLICSGVVDGESRGRA